MLIIGVLPILTFILLYYFLLIALVEQGFRKREIFIFASVIWATFVTVSTETLSLFHQLSFWPLLLFWILGAAVIIYFIHSTRKFFPLKNFLEDVSLSRLEWAMVSITAIIVTLVGIVAFLAPPNSWDALNYHMSRVMFWKQNRSVEYYPTPEFRQLFFQPLSSFAILHFQILTDSDRFANLTSWFAFLGCMINASLIASTMGLNPRFQVLTVFLIATLPTAIIEASTVRVDMLSAYWLSSFVALMLAFGQKGYPVYIFFLGLTLGLGMLTKGTIYLMVFPFVIWLFYILIKGKGWRGAVKAMTVIGLIAFMINVGFFYRNFKLSGDPLGPPAMRHWGLTEHMTPPLVFSNVVRTVGHELGNSIPSWNKLVVKTVKELHASLGINIVDKRSTSAGTPFHVSVSVHEDSVTNFLQTVLILASFGAILWKAKSKLAKEQVLFVISLMTAFIMVCSSIKWTNHITRYNLPLMILSTVAVACFLERSKYKRELVLWVLVGALTVTAIPYVFRNNLRRIVSTKKETIFNTPRLELYFRNDRSLLKPYLQAVAAVHKMDCDQVGLYMGFNYWDYPLWVIFEKEFPHRGRLEHLKVGDVVPKEYPKGDFHPRCLIAVDTPDEEIQLGPYIFIQAEDFDKTKTFILKDPAMAVNPVSPQIISVL